MFACGQSAFVCGREGDGVGDGVGGCLQLCYWSSVVTSSLLSPLQETKPLLYSPLMLQQFDVLGMVPPSTLKDIPSTLEMLRKKAVSTKQILTYQYMHTHVTRNVEM